MNTGVSTVLYPLYAATLPLLLLVLRFHLPCILTLLFPRYPMLSGLKPIYLLPVGYDILSRCHSLLADAVYPSFSLLCSVSLTLLSR